jgi:aminoglycoside phosphotransferase (APT) family kinase protein
MSESEKYSQFEQLLRQIDPSSKLLRLWEVKGGVSAQVTALEVERGDGATQKLIVRQHGEVDLKNNPQVAAHEYKLLQFLHSAGLPTPKPYYLDQSCVIFPTPYIVLEYVEGKTELEPAEIHDLTLQLATQLSRIHKVEGESLELSFLKKQKAIIAEKCSNRPAILDDSLDEGLIRDTLEPVWPSLQRNRSVLLHGDFWPGNLLWKDGQIVAVIDWEDAHIGDPLADVANARLEILWAFGTDAMQQFTAQYLSLANLDTTNLHYWDLVAALRPASKLSDWGLDPSTEQKMRGRHRWFVARALEQVKR